MIFEFQSDCTYIIDVRTSIVILSLRHCINSKPEATCVFVLLLLLLITSIYVIVILILLLLLLLIILTLRCTIVVIVTASVVGVGVGVLSNSGHPFLLRVSWLLDKFENLLADQ
jgi:hypothetical protein